MKNARCSANDGRLREDVIETQDPHPDVSHVRFLRADAVRSVEFPFLGHVGFLHVTSVPPVSHVSLWPSSLLAFPFDFGHGRTRGLSSRIS